MPFGEYIPNDTHNIYNMNEMGWESRPRDSYELLIFRFTGIWYENQTMRITQNETNHYNEETISYADERVMYKKYWDTRYMLQQQNQQQPQ